MITIIGPAPMLKESSDQIEVRKAFNDMAKTVSDAFNKPNTAASNSYPVWTPYPAGSYVFPSGSQSASAGQLTVGAVTTAPAFGAGAVLQAYYRNWGKSVDLMWFLQQTAASASAGSGFYLLPMPLGILIDTTLASLGLTTDTVIGSAYQGMMLRGFDGANTWNAIMSLVPITTTYFQAVVTYTSTAGVANNNLWRSTVFNPNGYTKLNVSGIITGIPIQ